MDPRTEQPDPIGYAIKRVQQALRSTLDAALREHGVTTPQFAALTALSAGGPLSGAELARRCFVTPQTMNGIIVGLEKGGWVRRAPHAEHGRVIETHLTGEGVSLLHRAEQDVQKIEEAMLVGFTPEERQELSDALHRCADNLA